MTVDPRAEPWLDVMAQVAHDADAAFPDLLVENKGRVAVTVHWRNAPSLAAEAQAFAAGHVVVLSSLSEGLPLTVIEAGMSGRPTVVTDVGGNGEAVTPETGVVVAPGDPAALAAALVGLLRDPARRASMAEASRTRHAEHFSAERMVAETAAVYDGVLGKPSARPRGTRRMVTGAGAAAEARDAALVRHPIP